MRKAFVDPGHMTCAKEEMTEKFFDENPGTREAAMKARAEAAIHTADYEAKGGSGQTLFIPVVFHIIHSNGDENISNAQIHSAIEVLNEDFNASTPNIQNVVPAFSGVVGDVDVQFRLAQKDPNGDCTNGIIRTISASTFSGGTNLTSASPIWPRNRYLNVYICANIGDGVAGFTFIPADVNGAIGAGVDAIYITHPYVGRIGTGNPTRSHALSHEVGHWLNLEHTWGVTNQPGVPSNCNQDDGVSDTPNTIGWTTCNLSGNTCNSLDNVENFMDYAYCYKMFTAGQSSRMRAALASSLAQRNQLSTPSNLQFTGITEPAEICEADFTVVGSPSICPGMELEFQDLSFNGVTNWSWSFQGGSPASSNEANPTVTYNQPGNYDVSLSVSNPNGSMQVTKQALVRVLPTGDYELPLLESFEEMTEFGGDNNWEVINPDGDETREWEITSNAAYSGSNSAFVMGRFNSNGAIEVLETPTFKLSDVSESAEFTFKYAHARRNNNSDDRLRVFVSRNCGEFWNLRVTLNMADLPTVPGNVSGAFVPSGQDDWETVSIPNIMSIFLTDEFRVRFEFTSFVGNNIFIDDINVFDPLTVSTEDQDFADGVNLYPNPSGRGPVSLEYNLFESGRVRAELIDLSGRTLDLLFDADRAAGRYISQYDVSHLAPGVYFVRLNTEGSAVVKKLIVQ